MSEYLKKDTPLKFLDLSNNRIENEGCQHIADALIFSNRNLEKLAIKYNNIKAEGLCGLFDALENGNLTLTHIYIWGNILEEAACIVIEFGLENFG